MMAIATPARKQTTKSKSNRKALPRGCFVYPGKMKGRQLKLPGMLILHELVWILP